MKYLLPGSQCPQRFQLILEGTRITSEDIINALRDHLVTGHPESQAAALNQVKLSNFKRALDKMNHEAGRIERVKELDWARFARSVK